jgi:hypothetical protein
MYLQNKYTRIYNLIIERAKHRDITSYHEKHHIIPQSLGGSNNIDNIVKLTAREHFICHLLLTKMTEGTHRSKMCQAAWMMASTISSNQQRYRVNNRIYENLRLQMSTIKKNITTWNKGITPSVETKKKLRTASLLHLVKQGKMSQEEFAYRSLFPIGVKLPNRKKWKSSL